MADINAGPAPGKCKTRSPRFDLTGAFGSLGRAGTSRSGRPQTKRADETPLRINGDKDSIFLEVAYRLGSTLLIVGWSTDVEVSFFRAPHDPVPGDMVLTHDRHDVAESLGITSPKGLGFSLRLEGAADIDVLFVKGKADCSLTSYALPFKETLSEALWPILGPHVYEILATARVGSALWHEIRKSIPVVTSEREAAAGFLEGMMVSPLARGAVVYGWALIEAKRILWLEADDGTVVDLDDVFRRPRPDVLALFSGRAVRDCNIGLIAFLPGLTEGAKVRLWTASAEGQCIVSECGRTQTLPASPLHAAQQLFGVDTPSTLLAERYSKVDAHVLAPLAERRIQQFRATAEVRKNFGEPKTAPDTSIIIPLYGQYHFMEHQVMEFVRDAFIGSSCEVIYVVDDPALIDQVVSEGHRLFRLFGLPLTFVWSGLNFGYSGANNLGARIAAGRNLLFLNSDVIPVSPGWLERMVASLETEGNAGAVGAQLLYPDGSIQHAGMKFEYDGELGVWINQHPFAGICANLMSESGPREVPALTGACLLISREQFDAAGGWDMGYIVGDFEDSDLCLTLRRRGLRCIYEPRARLVHLERQSIRLVGLDQFRFRLTVVNASRHSERWSEFLTADEHGTAG